MDEITLPFEIKKQGAPIVNLCVLVKTTNTKSIVCLTIDLKSKYCQIDSSYEEDDIINISIVATKRSVYLNKDCKKYDPTDIILKQYAGYELFATQMIGKYTINITLIKKDSHERIQKY